MFESCELFPSNALTAVILAGGLGTRIRHLAPDTPKPMIPVLGKPFLEWVIRFLIRQGVRRIVLSVGFKGEIIEHYFAGMHIEGVSIQCARESNTLGTAGGFLNAIQVVSEPPKAWLVLNGDSILLAPIRALVDPLSDPQTMGSLFVKPMADASRFGTILSDESKNLIGFQEKRAGAGAISAGIYVLRPATVAAFPTGSPLSFETDVFPALIAKQMKLKVCTSDAPFIDIGTPESLSSAERFVRETGFLSLSA
jgi:NDP-sugar pyrophosphorylase family protein